MPVQASEDAVAIRRKRLIFRSWHRGIREMDLLMGTFADRHVPGFDQGQLDRYEAFLHMSDPDVYNWISGREPVPPEFDNDVFQLLKVHRVV
ncbi:MAG TPA: succinate dehydrogenase assembly factor 2 [Azospirillaceae bacterium]|nr:succinate dehydrogenase assembly factor 2 [Azospirillaceae bacterium]